MSGASGPAKKSDVGLIRIMPADGTVAAITPAEISASFPRQRQLADSLYRPRQKRHCLQVAEHVSLRDDRAHMLEIAKHLLELARRAEDDEG